MKTLDRVFSVQYCTKSIKITWNRNFSNVVLSGASGTTLHKVFTCAMVSQDNCDNIEKDFFLCNGV